jgi:hypothetical protein
MARPGTAPLKSYFFSRSSVPAWAGTIIWTKLASSHGSIASSRSLDFQGNTDPPRSTVSFLPGAQSFGRRACFPIEFGVAK